MNDFRLVSDCETPDATLKENVFFSSNTPQPPPSSATKPSNHNIRRAVMRISSEQISTSNESASISSNSATPLYQARSPESSNVSFESGYDSNNVPQPAAPPSSNSSNLERKFVEEKRKTKFDRVEFIFNFRQSPFSRSRPPSSTPSISISQKRLRPTDPVSQLLDIVHKIVYISLVKRSIRFHFHR